MPDTLSKELNNYGEALNELKREGYHFHFIKKNEFLYCIEKEMHFRIYELEITEKFRFENKNEPSQNIVLYAVESLQFKIKGYVETK